MSKQVDGAEEPTINNIKYYLLQDQFDIRLLNT